MAGRIPGTKISIHAITRRPGRSKLKAVRGKVATVRELACIGCGCTEFNACDAGFGEGCYWIAQNAKTGRGICSECVIAMFIPILFPDR